MAQDKFTDPSESTWGIPVAEQARQLATEMGNPGPTIPPVSPNVDQPITVAKNDQGSGEISKGAVPQPHPDYDPSRPVTNEDPTQVLQTVSSGSQAPMTLPVEDYPTTAPSVVKAMEAPTIGPVTPSSPDTNVGDAVTQPTASTNPADLGTNSAGISDASTTK